MSEREIRVAPEPYLLKHRRCEFYRPVHPFGSSIVGGAAARPIHEIEHLIGMGESHNQRRVSPDSVISNVHPFLALACGFGDRAIHVKDGFFPENGILQAPDLLPRFVEGFLQSEDPILVESTQKIAGGRGIRDPFGVECVHVGFVVAQSFDVFQAGAACKDVVGNVQHMIRFPVRHMDLQQRDVFIDRPVQFQLAHQLVHSANPTKTDCPGSFGNLTVDVGVFEHRIGLVLILFSHQPGIEILLVTEVDSVISFIHLECAPFGCIGYLQYPIITNSDTYSRPFCKFSL